MRLKVIMPVITEMWNRDALSLMQAVASKDSNIVIKNIEGGPISIESEYDEVLSAPYVLKETIQAEKEGFDAVIIYCFSNPGLYAAREKVSIPVIGIGEAAQIMAYCLGERIGIITTIKNSVIRNIKKSKIIGTADKVCSVVPLDIPVMELSNNELVEKKLHSIMIKLLDDGVDTVIFGCGSIMHMKEKMMEKYRIPVIIPGEAAVKLAEALVCMNISHSKKAYPYPPLKKRTGYQFEV
ncbi:aspartate/glutamate racemase family protein [Calorimonas adulescens]|jgi:Asp/Glu/Hydantoin racemase.|uniref:Hydrogenase expression protein HupH n=1 Tax=Calorimonas adulescens TaxID=2606906 RepID=A0A5D8QEM7_9THEO|nr:aspartate/glutamate racemase family protein [Calorimonas adulescens]TZE82296.1 hypothetical protein FWJ32_05975 [Calorimonas adulescens]